MPCRVTGIKRWYETLPNGAIRNVGLRRAYQEAKREYKRKRRL